MTPNQKTLDELEGIARALKESRENAVLSESKCEEFCIRQRTYHTVINEDTVLDLIARARRAERLEMALEKAQEGLIYYSRGCLTLDPMRQGDPEDPHVMSRTITDRQTKVALKALAAIDAALKEET